MGVLESAGENLVRWGKYPKAFAEENFEGFDVDEPWQDEFFSVLPQIVHPRIALQAAKGPGKTALEAIAIYWFLSTQGDKGKHPKGFGISITRENLKDFLWTELQKWRLRSKFISEAFEWTQSKIYLKQYPDTWYFSARGYRQDANKDQQANALAGLHEDYTLVVIDESGGVPDAVMSSADGSLSTGVWNKIIQGGNPTHCSGPLYRAATTERDMWYLIRVTGDPDDPKRSKRMKISWCIEQIRKWGRENPWVKVNVFNEFPPTSINALFGPEEVAAMMSRRVPRESYEHSQRRIGVDVAGGGDDKTILFPRQGLAAFRPVEMRNAKPSEIAARIVLAKARFRSEMELVDNTGGFGSGVINYAQDAGLSPIPVEFAGKADDPGFYNKRAEMWFRMSEWGKRGGALPNLPALTKQLTTATYTQKNGKFLMEPKELMKERLGSSPDEADALCCTFCIEDLPGSDPLSQLIARVQGSRRAEAEYDVLADHQNEKKFAENDYNVLG